MDTSHHQRRRKLTLVVAAVAAIAFLLLASLSTFGFGPSCQFSIGVRKIKEEVAATRRRLSGPGSSPPTCRSKCADCAPCQPVHVPIQPGFSMKLEYYPEAWRCRCRNKLFMP